MAAAAVRIPTRSTSSGGGRRRRRRAGTGEEVRHHHPGGGEADDARDAAQDAGGQDDAASPSPATETGAPGSGGSVGVGNVPRMSGLRAPAAGASKIGRVGGAAHGRTGSTVSAPGGLPRPGSGAGMRSGLLSSIEKMGNYRGRVE